MDGFRGGIRGDIEVLGVPAQEQVTYRASHQVGLVALVAQSRHHLQCAVTDILAGDAVLIPGNDVQTIFLPVAMGVGTAAKSNTDVNLASRGAGLTLAGWEVNDGENKVFPIQVSRQELLLFLGAVIVIGTYKNTFYINAQTVNSVNFTVLGISQRQAQTGVIPTLKRKLKGKKTSPSRSIVKCIIFIAATI